MSLAQSLYRAATSAAEPLFGLVMRRRLKAGKEVAGRTPERFARSDAPALPGEVIWLHGASIGETRLLLEVAKKLHEQRPGYSILFTSQTATSAQLIAADIARDPRLQGAARHQFAPIDTPAIARRFIARWKPCLFVLAEGEIWPNLLTEARRSHVPTALINARMTENSLKGWARWPAFSRTLFASFDVMLAADARTAEGLAALAGRPVEMPGNLKSALPPPAYDANEAAALKAAFIGERACLVAVSTHEGEEEFVLDALANMKPRPACIIAPRHPERGPGIAQTLRERGLSFAVRSAGEAPDPDTDVFLADTLGEIGLFAALADTVYLGGGHAPGIGGHNPLEILRLGKPVASGPAMFNFSDMKAALERQSGFNVIDRPEDLVAGFPFAPPTDETLAAIEKDAQGPMLKTVSALLALLPQEANS